MATYQREPIVNSDFNIWGDKELAQNRINQGNNTCLLFGDSGDLKISLGRIGINTGSSFGVVEVIAEETISLVAIPSGNWAQIEAQISGTAVVFTAVEIVGATNANTVPSDFINSYNADRAGYYNGVSRILGIAWKNSGGALTNIINANPNVKGFNGKYESGGTALLYGTAEYKTKVIEITADYTITSDDLRSSTLIISFTRQASDQTLTFPSAAISPGSRIIVSVTGGGAGDLLLAGAEQINGINLTDWVFQGVGVLDINALTSGYISTSGVFDTITSGVEITEKYANGCQVNRTVLTIEPTTGQNNAFGTTAGTEYFTNVVWTYNIPFLTGSTVYPFSSASDRAGGVQNVVGSLEPSTTALTARQWSAANNLTYKAAVSVNGVWA